METNRRPRVQYSEDPDTIPVDFESASRLTSPVLDPRVPLLPTVLRATTQPTLLLPRCNKRLLQQRSVRQRSIAATGRNPLQQRIACCNSAHYHNTARCTTAQSAALATEHRMVQQSTIPSSTLHLLQRSATVQPIATPVAALDIV